jgi:hypothetical protein
MEIVDEFRHLEGIMSNIMLSESEYIAPAVVAEEKNCFRNYLLQY